jgi:3-phytase
MNNIFTRIIAAGLLFTVLSCNTSEKKEPAESLNADTIQPGLFEVTATLETQPVQSADDAADDPCIWYNEADPDQSRIIATNKKSGLVVYDLSGNELYKYPVGRVNNVDLRYDFVLGGDTIDIAGATNRSYNSLSFFRILGQNGLETLSLHDIISATNEVYGFCFYKSAKTGKLYANLVAKSGDFEQYLMNHQGGLLDVSLVRTFHVGSQCEGMVANDRTGELFIGEEAQGVWKYYAEPDSGDIREKVVDVTHENLKADIEGLTLYHASALKSYLIVSSQGNNNYAVFDCEGGYPYHGNFSIIAGDSIDAVSETDGIDVINLSVGSRFPTGFFIAQDGENLDNGLPVNQNFKVVPWESVASVFTPPLVINGVYDYR